MSSDHPPHPGPQTDLVPDPTGLRERVPVLCVVTPVPYPYVQWSGIDETDGSPSRTPLSYLTTGLLETPPSSGLTVLSDTFLRFRIRSLVSSPESRRVRRVSDPWRFLRCFDKRRPRTPSTHSDAVRSGVVTHTGYTCRHCEGVRSVSLWRSRSGRCSVLVHTPTLGRHTRTVKPNNHHSRVVARCTGGRRPTDDGRVNRNRERDGSLGRPWEPRSEPTTRSNPHFGPDRRLTTSLPVLPLSGGGTSGSSRKSLRLFGLQCSTVQVPHSGPGTHVVWDEKVSTVFRGSPSLPGSSRLTDSSSDSVRLHSCPAPARTRKRYPPTSFLSGPPDESFVTDPDPVRRARRTLLCTRLPGYHPPLSQRPTSTGW